MQPILDHDGKEWFSESTHYLAFPCIPSRAITPLELVFCKYGPRYGAVRPAEYHPRNTTDEKI
jgi:hypothetical protein